MSTEVARTGGSPASLSERMDYARALATSDLLPAQYRNKPGNVLLAVEYGQALGIPPMTAIQGIHVIQGKPTLSADLMAAMVRRAGHRLRVRVDDGPVGVAELIRSDDPEYTYRCSWDIGRAKAADLLGKDNWKHHLPSMLKARAISEVVREGASEVLHGLIYTAEELDPNIPVGADGDVLEGAVVATPQTDGGAEAGDAREHHAPSSDIAMVSSGVSSGQLAKISAMLREQGITTGESREQDRTAALAYVGNVIGRNIASRNELTWDEAGRVIDALDADAAALESVTDDTADAAGDPPLDGAEAQSGDTT